MQKSLFHSIRWLHISLLITITAIVFFIVFKTFDISGFSHTFSNLNKKFVILGVLVSLLGSILGTWRWQALLSVIGHNFSFKRIFLINMSNGPLMLLPGRTGDFVKSYALKDTVPMSHTIGTILLEKIVDISSLLVFVIFGGLIADYSEFSFWSVVCLATIIVSLAILSRFRNRWLVRIPTERARGIIERLSHILSCISNNKTSFLFSIVSSLLNWSTNMVMVYFFFRAASAPVPMSAVFALLPISIFVSLIPITLAGMGTRDSALISLFARFATASQALSVGILYSFTTYWLAIIIGIPFYRYMRPIQKINSLPNGER